MNDEVTEMITELVLFRMSKPIMQELGVPIDETMTEHMVRLEAKIRAYGADMRAHKRAQLEAQRVGLLEKEERRALLDAKIAALAD